MMQYEAGNGLRIFKQIGDNLIKFHNGVKLFINDNLISSIEFNYDGECHIYSFVFHLSNDLVYIIGTRDKNVSDSILEYYKELQ